MLELLTDLLVCCSSDPFLCAHPVQVMELLSDLYSKFDELAAELQVYTVDTIGGAFLSSTLMYEIYYYV